MYRPLIQKCLLLVAFAILTAGGEITGDYVERNTPRIPSMALRRGSPSSGERDPHLRHARAVDRASRKHQRRALSPKGNNLWAPENEPSPISLEIRQVTSDVIGPIETGTTIIPAAPPKTPDSLGISQDGTDFSYFSTINFGSSQKPFLLVIDTGSTETWIAGDTCKSSACSLLTTFGAADSTTLVQDPAESFDIKYGSGDVKGVLANDTMSFAGFTVNAAFGLATVVSDDFLDFEIDGIFGLGSTDSQAGTSIIFRMVEQGVIEKRLFGVSLSRASDGTNDGVINFGGVDKTLFEGELAFAASVSTNGLWEIAVDGAAVDGHSVKVGTSRTAVVDTGTSLLLLPPDDAAALHALVPGTKSNGETFAVPCNTTATLSFTFGSVAYTIPTEDYVGATIQNDPDFCLSLVSGRAVLGDQVWLFGDVFLKNVYSVYDIDNLRVGFAKKPSSTTENSSTPEAVATYEGPSLSMLLSRTLDSLSTPTSSSSGHRGATLTSTIHMSPTNTEAGVQGHGAVVQSRTAGWLFPPLLSFILAAF